MNEIKLSSFSIDDLKKVLIETIEGILKNYSNVKIEDALLTRRETANLLRISLPTLNELSKKGKITSYREGGRVLYKKDEVLASLAKVPTVKYGRAA